MWKDFEGKLRKGGCTDDRLQKAVIKKREKWRHRGCNFAV
jgi:hypothetical protein